MHEVDRLDRLERIDPGLLRFDEQFDRAIKHLPFAILRLGNGVGLDVGVGELIHAWSFPK
ncbi:hypothetical protein D9M69_680720 [compost metagenome]